MTSFRASNGRPRVTEVTEVSSVTAVPTAIRKLVHGEEAYAVKVCELQSWPSPENPVSASPALVGYNTPSDIIRTALVREPSSRTARCAACWGVESAASMPATRAECRIPAAPRTPAALAQPAWSRGLFRLFAHESTSARVHTRTRGATRVPFR